MCSSLDECEVKDGAGTTKSAFLPCLNCTTGFSGGAGARGRVNIVHVCTIVITAELRRACLLRTHCFLLRNVKRKRCEMPELKVTALMRFFVLLLLLPFDIYFFDDTN